MGKKYRVTVMTFALFALPTPSKPASDPCNLGVRVNTDYSDPDKFEAAIERYCELKPCDTISIMFKNFADKLYKDAETAKAQGTYTANNKAAEQCAQEKQDPGSAYCVRLLDQALAPVDAKYLQDMAYANETRRWFTEVEMAMTADGFCLGPVSVAKQSKVVRLPSRISRDLLGRSLGPD